MDDKRNRIGSRTGTTSTRSGHLWVIILAGGEGIRMRPLVEKWLGEERPKQFCTFVGSRSMLQHTVDRALALVDSDHILVVSMYDQRPFLDEITVARPSITGLNGQLLEQPFDAGTGAGVFLGAAHALSQDPEATLLILPSDQFYHPEKRFIEYAQLCVQYAEQTADRMILLGAKPENVESDYGWIVPGTGGVRESWGSHRQNPMRVARFHEKPDRDQAEVFFGMVGSGTRW